MDSVHLACEDDLLWVVVGCFFLLPLVGWLGPSPVMQILESFLVLQSS